MINLRAIALFWEEKGDRIFIDCFPQSSGLKFKILPAQDIKASLLL